MIKLILDNDNGKSTVMHKISWSYESVSVNVMLKILINSLNNLLSEIINN
jgi:hypothetical protein